MATIASRFWSAIVITGAALTGCDTSGTPQRLDLGRSDLGRQDLSVVFADPDMAGDMTTPPRCMPDLSLFNPNPDGNFDPRNGCPPGATQTSKDWVCGDECGNCVPCFI